jgi:hypothetical protein
MPNDGHLGLDRGVHGVVREPLSLTPINYISSDAESLGLLQEKSGLRGLALRFEMLESADGL